jgi:hypothetical protein
LCVSLPCVCRQVKGDRLLHAFAFLSRVSFLLLKRSLRASFIPVASVYGFRESVGVGKAPLQHMTLIVQHS